MLNRPCSHYGRDVGAPCPGWGEGGSGQTSLYCRCAPTFKGVILGVLGACMSCLGMQVIIDGSSELLVKAVASVSVLQQVCPGADCCSLLDPVTCNPAGLAMHASLMAELAGSLSQQAEQHSAEGH